ncbi:MAG: reverse transcriptase-like protein [Candidatus Nitrosothermus koennekii]|nr:MAG: reverse transcriptase-like protein [Candidatus Nitrosothermus koennekii]
MLHVYVDGSGKPKSTYCYYVKETDQFKYYKSEQELTNNQAEYLAIRSALTDLLDDKDIVIYSDSKLVVNQLNREYAINDEILRGLAFEIWNMIANANANVRFEWISRKENPAGKMLGS